MSGTECAWLHLSAAAARRLAALVELPASPAPTGVEVGGAPADARPPAGATTTEVTP